jgi:hypothetical protein
MKGSNRMRNRTSRHTNDIAAQYFRRNATSACWRYDRTAGVSQETMRCIFSSSAVLCLFGAISHCGFPPFPQCS